jgi:hypothetical protein
LIGMGQDRIVVDGADGVHEDPVGTRGPYGRGVAGNLYRRRSTHGTRRRWSPWQPSRGRLRLSSPAAFSVSDTGPVLTDVGSRPRR